MHILCSQEGGVMSSIVAPILSNFNAGQLSPLLDGRVDLAKYGNGCYRLENFVPTVQGPIKRRMAFRAVGPTRAEWDRSWLRKFVFSQNQAFMLEFGPGTLKFYTNHGPVLLPSVAISGITQANPAVVTTSVAHGFSSGQQVYITGLFGMEDLNSWEYIITVTSPTTFQLNGVNSTGMSPYVSGGSAASIYSIATPYNASDLTNFDGTLGLSFAQTGDVVFIADGRNPLQQLTRLGNTNWTLANANVEGGPFEDVNPDQVVTVQASSDTGAVNLTASSSIFTADNIGTFFLIEQPQTDAYFPWEVNKLTGAGLERRSDANVYYTAAGGTTGTVKPTHKEGSKYDGSAGVLWEYRHSGYGVVLITGVASGTAASGTVVSRLPSTTVTGPTNRWAFASWSAAKGYPSLVTFFRERLTLFRKASGWFSVAADFLNFANRDGAETLPDSAITIDITTSELNDSTWLVPAKKLLVGTVGAEFAVSELSINDVFGPGNVSASLQTKHGSRQVEPAIVNDSTLFIHKAGKRLRDLRYAFDSDGYQTADLQVLSTDIARGQVTQMTFQEEPDNVLWAACANGTLIGFTFNREQDVVGWHSHPLPDDVFIESIESIPSPDGTQDEVWAIFRVIVGGVTHRYVAYQEKDWRDDEQELDDCLYSDLGSTFSGMDQPGTITLDVTFTGPETTGALTSSASKFRASDIGSWVVIEASTGERCRFQITAYTSASVVTGREMDGLPTGIAPGGVSSDWAFARGTITGLRYLAGREVAILGDGASHPNAVVDSLGRVVLQRNVRTAQIGLPMMAEVETMRIEAGAENGTAQGKTKRIHRVTLRLFESLGGRVGARSENGEKVLDQILYRKSSMPMNQPPALFTGDKSVSFPQGYSTDARIIVQADQPLPMTLVAIMPQLVTNDRGGNGG
jgi:ubiquitin-activating enzyme E1-like protein